MPPRIDSARWRAESIRVAHPARGYDYWLGGKDNFAADREAAQQVLAAQPGIRFGVRANRAFLRRVVSYLALEAGVRQFLDIGTDIPTRENTIRSPTRPRRTRGSSTSTTTRRYFGNPTLVSHDAQ